MDARASTRPVVKNILLAVNGVEYTYTCPEKTAKLLIQARESQAFSLAFQAGGTFDKFLQIKSDESYSEDNLAGEIQCYFATSAAPMTIEILTWAGNHYG